MPDEDLPDSPDAFLTPRDGYIYGKRGEWAVIVALEPFQLDGKTTEAKVDLDGFPWEVGRALDLAGTAHEYTDDDRDEQDVEGSIYLRGAHHPVDVSRIAFKAAGPDELLATIDCDVDFSYEGGGFKNRGARIVCRLKCREPKGALAYRVIK